MSFRTGRVHGGVRVIPEESIDGVPIMFEAKLDNTKALGIMQGMSEGRQSLIRLEKSQIGILNDDGDNVIPTV